MKPIYQFNLTYSALRPLVEFATKCHYRRFVIRGKKHLPKGCSYIIAPNHQNAMMDPLVLLCSTHQSIVFLCRSDIFAKPVANFFLTWLKILPVYRIRDGKENLSKNDEIFAKSREVLLHRVPLCLFSEGRHNDKHQLLPLVKGMFRIAGDTQHRLADKPLYIVPTGLDYDDYERPFSNIVMHIGKPIDIRPYLSIFLENEPQALVQMREALTEGLTQQMHHIQSKEHYREFYTLSNIANRHVRRRHHRVNSAWNRFITRKEITAKADLMEQQGDSRLNPLVDLVCQYQQLCKTLGVREKFVAERWGIFTLLFSTLAVVAIVLSAIMMPMARQVLLFLVACYPIIYLPTRQIPQYSIKDTQFRSSINFAIRFVLSIFYVLTFSIVCGCTKGMWLHHLMPNLAGFWWGIIAVVAAFVIAGVGGHYITWLREIGENYRFRGLQIAQRGKTRRLLSLLKEIERYF